MDINCKNCGGQVIELARDGGSVKVKCTCCGSVYSVPLAPKKVAPTRESRYSEPSYGSRYSEPSYDSRYSEPSRNFATSEMAGEDIYDRNIKAVVEITTESGRASGYFISRSGIIMTNTHAVTDDSGRANKSVSVRVDGRSYPAKVIALGDDRCGDGDGIDLALLVAEGSFECVTLGCSAKVRNGEQVYYIGNSRGEGSCITGGIVSDRDRQVGAHRYIMTDAATNPGNSGGPLINKNGEVIGTHVSARTDAVGMKYAIPIDTCKEFIVEVAHEAGVPVAALCDSPISTSHESLGLVLASVKLVTDGILIVKNIIAMKKKR